MIVQIATGPGENSRHRAGPPINSLYIGITAILDCVLQELQAAKGGDLVLFESATQTMQVLGLMRLTFVHSKEFVIAMNLVKHSHLSPSLCRRF
jgi:hypothetical protein